VNSSIERIHPPVQTITRVQLEDRPYAFKKASELRAANSPFEWFAREDVSFLLKSSHDKDGDGDSENARNIFSEEKNHILLLRIRNRVDHLHDLFLVFFRPNLSNFGVSILDKPLGTDHKAIIGMLLSNTLKQHVQTYESDLQNFRSLSESVRTMSSRHEDDHRELNMIKENYGESLVALCRSYLQELSQQYRKSFILTEDALLKIKEYSGNLQTLKLILADAAAFVNQVYVEQDDLELKIHSWELNFNKYSVVAESKEDIVKMDSRESRAIQLLDKLERAAIELQRKHIPITSANVGGAFPTPITAPAITDALKKNRKKIIKILGQYPEKWSTVRFQFRPLKNILSESREGAENDAASG
jgi:hypothetical protein